MVCKLNMWYSDLCRGCFVSVLRDFTAALLCQEEPIGLWRLPLPITAMKAFTSQKHPEPSVLADI